MNRTTVPRPADHTEWLRLRHRWFNASDAGALIGAHPYRTLDDVIAAKRCPEPVIDAPSPAAMRGIFLEPAISNWYAHLAGVELYEPDVLFVVDDTVAATLDRLVLGDDRHAVEIKSSARLLLEPHEYWLAQVHLQIVCAGLDVVDVVILDPSMRLSVHRVERDDAVAGALIERAVTAMATVRQSARD